MAKTLTIRIKTAGEALADFGQTFKKVAARQTVRRREGTYFTSIEAARNLLTPTRLALVRAIRAQRPRSIYELAQRVHRDLKNVQEDLRVLERYGVVRFTEGQGVGRRRRRIPEAPFDAIELKIAI